MSDGRRRFACGRLHCPSRVFRASLALRRRAQEGQWQRRRRGRRSHFSASGEWTVVSLLAASVMRATSAEHTVDRVRERCEHAFPNAGYVGDSNRGFPST